MHEDDDFQQKIDRAKEMMEGSDKDVFLANRKCYYNKLMSSKALPIVDPEFADYYTIIRLLNSLKFDQRYEDQMGMMIETYNDIASIRNKFIHFEISQNIY